MKRVDRHVMFMQVSWCSPYIFQFTDDKSAFAADFLVDINHYDDTINNLEDRESSHAAAGRQGYLAEPARGKSTHRGRRQQ